MRLLGTDWDVGGLESALALDYSSDIPVQKSIDEGLNVDQVLKMILEGFMVSHKVKETAIGSETMRTFEKAVMLRALDQHWKDHLAVMDQLRQSVNLRGYGQKNPVQEYKRESFSMFTALLDTINSEMVKALCSLNIDQANAQSTPTSGELQSQEKISPAQAKKPIAPRPRITRQPSKLKVGRNDPCPCGSGKKYKQCHG
jgi:preprotein translocase subunit SecA